MNALLLLALLPLDLVAPGPAPAPPARERPSPPRVQPPKVHHQPPRGGGPLTVELVPLIVDRGRLALEVTHRWSGATPERFLIEDRGACAGPQDYLLVDGKARGFVELPCAGPAAPFGREIAPGGTWPIRGTIALAPGRHVVRAVYAVNDGQAALLERADNMIVFRGEARSPEVVVEVPPTK